jgi:hypothetical protein
LYYLRTPLTWLGRQLPSSQRSEEGRKQKEVVLVLAVALPVVVVLLSVEALVAPPYMTGQIAVVVVVYDGANS